MEQSPHRVIVEETPHHVAVWIFTVFAVLTLISLRDLQGIVLSPCFASLALYASTRSRFTFNRSAQVLTIWRSVAFWKFEKHYPIPELQEVYIRPGVKGNTLAVRFKSGRSRDLTTSFHRQHLEETAKTLNRFIR